MHLTLFTPKTPIFSIETVPVPGSLPATTSSRCASSWLQEDELAPRPFLARANPLPLRVQLLSQKISTRLLQSFQPSLYEFTYYYLDYLQYGGITFFIQ
jgi:hypothetical protein